MNSTFSPDAQVNYYDVFLTAPDELKHRWIYDNTITIVHDVVQKGMDSELESLLWSMRDRWNEKEKPLLQSFVDYRDMRWGLRNMISGSYEYFLCRLAEEIMKQQMQGKIEINNIMHYMIWTRRWLIAAPNPDEPHRGYNSDTPDSSYYHRLLRDNLTHHIRKYWTLQLLWLLQTHQAKKESAFKQWHEEYESSLFAL